MDNQLLKPALQKIYKRYPDFAGVQPKIKRHTETATYILTFQTSATARDGAAIPKLLRITVNEQGKIIKASTSR